MKIAIFSDNFFPELSGVSDSIRTTAQVLAARGLEIHFFVPRYAPRHYRYVGLPVAELALTPRIYVHRFSALPYPGPTRQSRLVIPLGRGYWALRKLRPDIIHTQSFFGVGFEALIAAKLLKIPFLGTNHTAIADYVAQSWFGTPSVVAWSQKAVAWYYNQCAYVTAPAAVLLEEMRAFNFKQPSRVAPNPIHLEVFKPPAPGAKAVFKKKWKFPEATILYAGRLAPEKHVDVIIRALTIIKEKIPSIILALAGRGSAEPDLRQLVKTLHLEKQVTFLGVLDQPALAEVYQAADAFAIASTVETQSLVLMQAMATGLPVVGVRAESLPEYINEQSGFLVEPGDYHALAERLVFLLTNPNISQKLGAGGLKTVAAFSPERIAKIWEELYTMVMRK